MGFLEEFDRRGKSPREGIPPQPDKTPGLSAEDRELLDFADLVRSRLPAPGGERERILERVRAAEAKGAAQAASAAPRGSKISRMALSFAGLAAGVLLVAGVYFASQGIKPASTPLALNDDKNTDDAIGAKKQMGGASSNAIITPAPRFEAKSIQDEFTGVSFPEPTLNEGQGAAAVETAADVLNARVMRVAGLAMFQNKNEKRWRVCSRGQALAPGALIRTSKRDGAGLRLLSPDGSALSLAPGTAMQYGGARAWTLSEGRAIFDVAARKDQEPFTVTTPHGKPRALGTQFTLEVSPLATLCWVDEGKVALNADGSEVCEAGGARVLDKAGVRRAEKSGPRDWLRALQTQMESDHGIGQLVASAEKSNERVPLEIKSHNVSVTAIDQVARTFVDMVFVNNSDRRLEGTFYYPLPPDASISEFAMYVGEQRIIGEVLEQQKARQVFEYIVRQQRDPALLEYAGGNLFKMRVFPIEPKSEKRVQLGYTQILPRSGGKVTYTYPLFSEMLIKNPLHDLRLTFNVSSSPGLAELASPTHRCASALSEDKLRGALAFRAANYSPTRDFSVTYEVPNAPECVAFANQRPDDSNNYFMLQLCPAARAPQSELEPRLLVIVDGSASSGPQDYAIATEFASSSADISRNGQFGLIRGGQAPEIFGGGMLQTDATTPDKVRQFLASRAPLGATDLLATFRAAAALAGNEGLRIVYVGDGIDTLSESSASALVRDIGALFTGKNVTLSTVAVGSSYERPVMQGLAAALGGTFARIEGADGVFEAAGHIFDGFYRAALRDVRVEFEGLAVNSVYPELIGTLTAGDTAVVLGRVHNAGKGRVVVRADSAGEAFSRTYEVDLSANQAQNRFLPRLWARAHIESLLAGMGLGDARQDGNLRNAVIGTSVTYQIMSPYTAFLVLESEEDYARFGIKRQLKQWDWMGDGASLAAGNKAPGEPQGQAAAKDGERLDLVEDGETPPDAPQEGKEEWDADKRKPEADGEANDEIDMAGSFADGPANGPARIRAEFSRQYDSFESESLHKNSKEMVDSLIDARSANGLSANQVMGGKSSFGYRSSYRRGGYAQQYYSLALAPGRLVELDVDQPLRGSLYYQRVMNAGKGTLSTQLNLSLSLESEGRFADALKALLPVLEKQPNLAELRLQEASLRYRTGDTAGGRAALDKAIALVPEKEREAFKERAAGLLSSLTRYAEAAERFAELYGKADTVARGQQLVQNLAQSYYNANQKEKAREAWEGALKRWPGEPAPRALAAQFFSGYLQDNARALEILRGGGKLDASGIQQLVTILSQSGKRDEALTEARKLIATAQDANAVYLALASIGNGDRGTGADEALKLLAEGGTAAQAGGALQYLNSYGSTWKQSDAALLLAAGKRQDLPGQSRISVFYTLYNLPQGIRPGQPLLVAVVEPLLANCATKEDMALAVQALNALAGRFQDENALKHAQRLQQEKGLDDGQRAQVAQVEFNVLQALGRKDEAAAKLRAMYEQQKDEGSLYSVTWNLFHQRLNENDMDGAVGAIERFAARFPKSAYIGQFHQQLIQRVRAGLKGKDAAALTERLLKAYPNNASYLGLRVQLLTQQGKWREAIEAVRAALKEHDAADEEPLEIKTKKEEPAPAAPQTEEQKAAAEKQKQALARQQAEERAERRRSLIHMLARLSSQDAELRAAFLKEAGEQIKGEDPGEREWTEAVLACLSASGDTAAYARRLEILAQAEPADPVWTRRLGFAQVSDKQFEKARATLTKVWEAGKDDFELALTLQSICLKLKDEKRAREWFSLAFEAIATDYNRLQQYAGQWQARNPEWSLLAWKRFAQAAPDSQKGYGHYQAGAIAQQLGRNAEAIEYYLDGMLAEERGYASGSLLQISALAQQEEHLRAIEPRVLKALTGAGPSRAVYLNLLRHRLEKLKNNEAAAKEILAAAVAARDVDFTAASQVVATLMNEKLHDQAEKYVLEGGGKLIDEQRRQLVRNLASSFQSNELRARQEKLYRRLLEKPDNNAEQDRSQLIQCLAGQGKFKEAEQELRAMKLTRESWAARNAWDNLIYQHQNAHRHGDALRLALERLTLEADDESGHREQAFGTYARVCTEALHNGKLDTGNGNNFRRELANVSREYFASVRGNPPWNYINHEDLAKLGGGEIDKLAAAAAASDDARRVTAAAQYYQAMQRRSEGLKYFQRALGLKGADERQIYSQIYALQTNPYADHEKPDWGNAIEVLEKLHALKVHDDNTYHSERGRCLYGLKRRDEARAEFRKLLDSPAYWRNGYWSAQSLAQKCKQAQDWQMAAEAWELSLRLLRRRTGARLDVSTAASFYNSCAQAYAQAGETDKATDCFLRGMSIVPRAEYGYKQLLESAIQSVLRGRTLEKTVEEYLKQAAAPGGGEKPHLRIAFAEAYDKAGNKRKMLEHLRVAADLLPRDLELRKQVIDGYRGLGDMNSALAAYKDWARLDPQNIEIYRGMGELYESLGKREDALLAWATMAEVRPREAEGYRAYAQKLAQLAQPGKAAVALRQAVKYRPAEFDPAQELSQIYRTLGQPDKIPGLWKEGEAACRKAIQDLEDDPLPWLNLGRFLVAQGRGADARQHYQSILQRQWPRFQNETYTEARQRLGELK